MLLTISTLRHPANDLSLLLLKNPDNVHSFELGFGKAHVFFSESSAENCTACLLLDVDSVKLVRGSRGGEGLEQYVNDRPYVCSSFMSVAIAQVYGSALSGKCKFNQELVDCALPLVAHLSVLPCRGGEELLRLLFEPLGYSLTCRRLPLDEKFPEWGESRYFSLELSAEVKLKDLLSHLYVLIPVLDDDKHYYVDEAEVEKLLRHGQGWLANHPQKNLISRRYLAHQQSLARLALSRLVEEDLDDLEEKDERLNLQEEQVERSLSLNEQRMQSVFAVLQRHEVRSVVDLGCGEGRYLKELFEQRQFDLVAGMDVSPTALEKAHDRLRLERLPERMRERISLFQGSLMYRDERLRGFDAAICVEVIEHMELSRLPSFEHTVFHFAAPELVVISTPNFEYNRKFESLPAGKFRHGDHRFEWTREQFQNWAKSVAERSNYQVYFEPIGPVDTECGAPTQMAVFSRQAQLEAQSSKGEHN